MNRLFMIVALLLFLLSACSNNDSKSNIISAAELTEREKALLSTISDKSFVFDFNIDSEYKVVSAWIEKYEFGEMVHNKISPMTTPVEGDGSIIFVTSKVNANQQQPTFNIGVSGNGSTGSISGLDTTSYDLDSMSSVWGSFQEENKSIEGEVVLASICYVSDGPMRSLTTDFYNDVDGHMNKLENYDVVYLLKAEFKK
ncbi:hypothetical protein QTL97_09665 [Sporosarcina thermotolerans]|uniref:Lipoprotein n=1 Tax=Sporosarcina thermotolerans TaxID=633404 RepID=A0AAW9A840_9BACL|nr:hypothetical protein [Sporosarcina thermotolerans]MDW0117204.1 hypothetical protein [Sporosarcina thermotolerans]WHT47375.1 hypothetical protein QNH10_14380 [Sporosarcina thermotolerans]